MEIEKLQIDFEGHKKYAEIVNKQQIRLINIFSIELEIPELWIKNKHSHSSIFCAHHP